MPLYLLFLFILTGCSGSEEATWQGFVEGENIYLASPDSGQLIHLAVVRGQTVLRDQLLYQLDKEPQISMLKQYENEYQQALHILEDLKNPRREPEIAAIKAQIAQTEADRKLALIRLDRYRKLLEKNAIPKDSVDAAAANLRRKEKLKKQYEANLKLSKLGSRKEQIIAQGKQISAVAAQLDQIKWRLSQKEMKAPAAGIVFDTFFREGEYVSAAQPVLALLTPENVRIEFFVPARDLPQLKLEQTVYVQCYDCTQKTKANISYISPEAEYIPPLLYSRENADKIVFRIRAAVTHPQDYKPGQPVMVFRK